MSIELKEIINKLRKLWFDWPTFLWRHAHMIKGSKIILVPLHWKDDMWLPTIMEEAWINEQAWANL